MKVKRNGHTIEFIPIYQKCTYYHQSDKGVCKNCNGTMRYKDGYTMIIDDKIAFTVDSIK